MGTAQNSFLGRCAPRLSAGFPARPPWGCGRLVPRPLRPGLAGPADAAPSAGPPLALSASTKGSCRVAGDDVNKRCQQAKQAEPLEETKFRFVWSPSRKRIWNRCLAPSAPEAREGTRGGPRGKAAGAALPWPAAGTQVLLTQMVTLLSHPQIASSASSCGTFSGTRVAGSRPVSRIRDSTGWFIPGMQVEWEWL